MTVDWEGILQEADDSPRSILAEVLGRAEEIVDLVVLFVGTDGKQHEYFIGSDQSRISMLALAHYTAVKEVSEQ